MKRSRTVLLIVAMAVSVHAAVPGAESLAKLITRQFDANGDTLLDAGEWQAGMKKGFDEVDRDSDGSITAEELDALADPLSHELGGAPAQVVVLLIKKIVLSLDADHNGSVSLKEFTGQTDALFKKLDADSSGSVDQAELQELPLRVIGF